MMSESSSKTFEIATMAIKEAGKIILEYLPEQKQLSYKGGKSNLVTNVDLLIDEKVKEIILNAYPDYGFLSEESPPINTDSPWLWILDPLDGTNNYACGIPFCCVSLALAKNEEVQLGLIYDPIRGEIFQAEKGKGAFLNHQPLSVSHKSQLEESFTSADLGYNPEKRKQMLEIINTLGLKLYAWRIMGSATLGLAYVACGRLDLYLHPSLYPWDSASAILLINEAGGKVTTWEGKPATINSPQIIAANPTLLREFISVLSSAISHK
jgi:myo-inositol-1(or 4)-monophosphatase